MGMQSAASVSSVLTLQRTAGNQATVAAMRAGRVPAAAPHQTLARCQGACKCGGACKRSGSQPEELLGELPGRGRRG